MRRTAVRRPEAEVEKGHVTLQGAGSVQKEAFGTDEDADGGTTEAAKIGFNWLNEDFEFFQR